VLKEYPTPESRARMGIDRQFKASSWEVQDYEKINLDAGGGVAVGEFVSSHDAVDYLLFADRGVFEQRTGDDAHRRRSSVSQVHRRLLADVAALTGAAICARVDGYGDAVY
jgi:hypothetical protein